MAVHNEISFPEFFQATIEGKKTHELREDREGVEYKVGDTIILEEVDEETLEKTGRTARLKITYVSPKQKPWMKPPYTLMSVKLRRWWNVF